MINKITGFGLLIALLAIACNNDKLEKAENAQDAGRQFIRASLDGDYRKAKFFLLKDDDNLRLFEKYHNDYQQLPGNEKRQYREANIHPLSITPINDSLTKYKYQHTANLKDTFTLSVVRVNGEWLVDLKSIIER